MTECLEQLNGAAQGFLGDERVQLGIDVISLVALFTLCALHNAGKIQLSPLALGLGGLGLSIAHFVAKGTLNQNSAFDKRLRNQGLEVLFVAVFAITALTALGGANSVSGASKAMVGGIIAYTFFRLGFLAYGTFC